MQETQRPESIDSEPLLKPLYDQIGECDKGSDTVFALERV